MSAVALHRVTKSFGATRAIDGVSLDIEAGQVVALLGRNGAGKTTITELLAGFQTPDRGTITVLGAEPRRADRRWRARIGVVLQSTDLDLRLTVRELLTAFAAAYPRPVPPSELLEVVDLRDCERTRIGALSGGQRRRVDLALGMIGRPALLFLDEPTTGLDPHARRRIWSTVQDLASAGTTVLLTSHYLDEAQQLADRVVVLDRGRIVADASPDDLRRRVAVPTIRCPLPTTAPVGELPPAFTHHLDQGNRLELPSTDPVHDLGILLRWAEAHHVDLSGLQVGPASLEDAYLTLTGADAAMLQDVAG